MRLEHGGEPQMTNISAVRVPLTVNDFLQRADWCIPIGRNRRRA